MESEIMEVSRTAISLRSSINIVRRRYGIVLAGMLISLIAAFFITRFSKPIYESSATLYVTGAQDINNQNGSTDSYEGVLMKERLARTYSKIITGRFVHDEVAGKLGLSEHDSIAADPVRDTNLIQITSKASDPRKAKAILVLAIRTFANKLSEIEPASIEVGSSSLAHSASQENKRGQASGIRVTVIDPPFLPKSPISPKPMFNFAVALVLGSIGSIALVLSIEYLDISIKTPDDLEGALGHPVLGSIPISSLGKADARGLEVFMSPTSPVSEAFLALRTNLQYLNCDRSLKTIAVTSAGPGEGKTAVASNLAAALAKSGSSVVLIGCDLRRPSIHEIFHMSGDRGLSNVIVGELSFMEALVQTKNGLNVIASGPVPPNPPELLGSSRMKEVIEQAKRIFDIVILDCPPVLPVTDALVLSATVDGFLLVARAGSTSAISVTRAKEALGKVSARILGAVLSFFDADSIGDYSGYGYGYYSNREPKKAPATNS